MYMADVRTASQSPVTHTGTDIVKTDILVGIAVGTPTPCNVMPDLDAVKADFAPDPLGHALTLSNNGSCILLAVAYYTAISTVGLSV